MIFSRFTSNSSLVLNLGVKMQTYDLWPNIASPHPPAMVLLGKVKATFWFVNRNICKTLNLLTDFDLHTTRSFFFVQFSQKLDDMNWSKLNLVHFITIYVYVFKLVKNILNLCHARVSLGVILGKKSKLWKKQGLGT